MDKILIIICARGGSKGVKEKNIKPLDGKPLIYYTIKQALGWGQSRHVVVSTDSQKIADIALKYGAEVPFIRPAKLATDTAPTIPVLRHALEFCERFYKETYDMIVDLPVTAPVRKFEDLERALKLFRKRNPKTLVSVVPAHRNPYFNMVEIDLGGRVRCSKSNDKVSRRQDAPVVYDMNNSIFIYSSKYLKDKRSTRSLSNNTVAYVMDPICGFDIDEEIDYKILELLVKEKVVKL